MLIRELDQVKSENYQAEDEQFRLLDQIAVTEREVSCASAECADLRHKCSSVDMDNLNCRKENDFL